MKLKNKYLKVFALLAFVAIFMTACTTQTKHGALTAPTVGPYAWIYSIFGRPLQNIMLFVEAKIGGSNGAGWAIALITLVVQLIVMPLRLNSSYKMTKQQEKTQKLQPQMQLIQNAMKDKNLTQPQQMQLSQLQMKIYKENNMSMMGGMGCLPLLIQLPIMMGIYQAVAYSSQLAKASFFGISLSQRSIVLTIIATALYVIQGYLSMIGLPEQQKKAMQMTLILSPAMTFFISISSSGALALYFLAGGIVIVIQQLITTFIVMPKVKKEVAEELKDKPLKTVVTQATIDEIIGNPNSNSTATPTQKKASNELHKDLRARNAGKQKRNKD
ncbi:membrane protein insertase YidC [Lactobacillus hominis]|uniref:Membrane protein OxaA 2 n=1 Tax=Lactobacillus hominis DSM 23910 = CRBIP 24.179 TaxID=1423758 RepID=I7KH42_9LACO|nr:membrane protein insertase YidC [Lactobacillus hominis]KRM85678.1 membrane protein [Lactobacillus hominis DSM 23910 = CRBIP 24.179]MCT3347273.1 membrane protein insertase YidC [Lactobacillus hominis]CCI81800.1 Membrane protein OxaA 2 [Lactobacillus hominis DSM 23910 = CRBIP 24.179]